MALADTAQLAVKITLDDRGFSGPLSRLQRNLGGLQKGFGRTGRGVGQLSTGLARAGTIIAGFAVGGIALATREALRFEDAFTGVRKTVSQQELDAAGTSFDELRQTFLQMSSEMPVAATQFAHLGEVAGALGVNAADIGAFARVTSQLGVATDNLNADEAADALGRIGTILNFTGQDFEHFADILVGLGNAGASTEAEIVEITKRFAGVGSQAGLSVEEITALSSAISSLGAQPEAGGSALARIFANITTEIANGTAKGKEFAEVTGDSLDELRKRINQGDALGIFMETLEGLSKMSRTEQASVLKALGITNVRDRDAIVKMAGNLDEVNRQLNVAENSTGALATEARKAFASPLQKLITLRGAAIRLAIAFGDGITPAIGRAADKLAGLFREQGNLDQATKLGESIGRAIDEIDWAKVLDGARQFGGILKGALDFTLLLLKTLNALPAEIKAAGVGFLALNKLSGGLVGAGVGNILGGLTESVARSLFTKIPGIGKFGALPVYVTNLGGLPSLPPTGPGAPAGGAGFLSSLAAGAGPLIAAAVVPLLLFEFTKLLAGGDEAIIDRAVEDRREVAERRGLDPTKVSTNPVPPRIAVPLTEIANNTAKTALNSSGSPDERQFNNDLLAKQEKQQTSLVRMRERIEANRIAIQTGTTKVATKQEATRTTVAAAKIAQIAANHSDTARLIGAIHAARPIVSVVVNAATNYTTTVRTGQTRTRASSDPQSKYSPKDY